MASWESTGGRDLSVPGCKCKTLCLQKGNHTLKWGFWGTCGVFKLFFSGHPRRGQQLEVDRQHSLLIYNQWGCTDELIWIGYRSVTSETWLHWLMVPWTGKKTLYNRSNLPDLQPQIGFFSFQKLNKPISSRVVLESDGSLWIALWEWKICAPNIHKYSTEYLQVTFLT